MAVMASRPYKVAARGRDRWRIQICVNGIRESVTMDKRSDVIRWANDREALLSSGAIRVEGRTVADACEQYGKTITPGKKGYRAEQARLKSLAGDVIGRVKLSALVLAHAEDYRDRRLNQVSGSSVVRELTVLKSVVKRAARWFWIDGYPFEGLENPKAGKGREVIYSDPEIQQIRQAAGLGALGADAPVESVRGQVGILFELAIETGMRLSEMTALKTPDVDLDSCVATLHDSKTGVGRRVPLSKRAVHVLSRRLRAPRPSEPCRIFAVTPPIASSIFLQIREQAGIQGKRFHDTRHTAATRLKSQMDPFDLARMFGWKNLDQALNYTNRSAADVAQSLQTL